MKTTSHEGGTHLVQLESLDSYLKEGHEGSPGEPLTIDLAPAEDDHNRLIANITELAPGGKEHRVSLANERDLEALIRLVRHKSRDPELSTRISFLRRPGGPPVPTGDPNPKLNPSVMKNGIIQQWTFYEKNDPSKSSQVMKEVYFHLSIRVTRDNVSPRSVYFSFVQGMASQNPPFKFFRLQSDVDHPDPDGNKLRLVNFDEAESHENDEEPHRFTDLYVRVNAKPNLTIGDAATLVVNVKIDAALMGTGEVARLRFGSVSDAYYETPQEWVVTA